MVKYLKMIFNLMLLAHDCMTMGLEICHLQLATVWSSRATLFWCDKHVCQVALGCLFVWSDDVKMTKNHQGDDIRWQTYPNVSMVFLQRFRVFEKNRHEKLIAAGQVKKRMIVSNLLASYQLTRRKILTSTSRPRITLTLIFCWWYGVLVVVSRTKTLCVIMCVIFVVIGYVGIQKDEEEL